MALKDSWIKKEFSLVDELEERRKGALLEEMGLEDRDVNKLRKMMLSADEAVAAKREELTRIKQTKNRKPEWQEFLDMKARMGYVMYAPDFLRRLRNILPNNLVIRPGRVRNTLSLMTYVTRSYEDGYHFGIDYIGWIHRDWSPEYTIDYVDADGCPRGKRQGWRTVLMELLTRKDGDGKWAIMQDGVRQNGTGLPLRIVTEDQVLNAFGDPTNGVTASIYRRELWRFRNGYEPTPNAWSF